MSSDDVALISIGGIPDMKDILPSSNGVSRY